MHRIRVHMRWNKLRCKTVWNDFVDNVFFLNANQANFVFNLRKHTYTFNPCVLKSLEYIYISLTNTQTAEQRNEQARLRDRKKWLSILCALLLYYFFLLLLLLLVWVLNFKCMLWNLFIRDTLKATRMQFRRTKQCVVYSKGLRKCTGTAPAAEEQTPHNIRKIISTLANNVLGVAATSVTLRFNLAIHFANVFFLYSNTTQNGKTFLTT